MGTREQLVLCDSFGRQQDETGGGWPPPGPTPVGISPSRLISIRGWALSPSGHQPESNIKIIIYRRCLSSSCGYGEQPH